MRKIRFWLEFKSLKAIIRQFTTFALQMFQNM